MTKFLVLNFHAKHQIFNRLNTWLLGAVNKFSKNNRSIDVGKAFNNNGDEITTPPTEKKLDEYEQTLQTFLDNKDSIVKDIAVKAYKYYKDRYADYYEVPFKVLFPNDMIMPPSDSVLHEPLGITTPEEHLHYMTFEACDHIRVLSRKTIIIPIQYTIDEEHGMEIKIVNGKVKAVQEKGISECE